MKFKKGDSEKWLWEYLYYNIYDSLEGLVDYSDQTIIDKLLSRPGKLKKNVEIIIKINGKVIDNNAWEKDGSKS